MVLLDLLVNSYETYKTAVHPEAEQETLSAEARYNLSYICTQVIGVSDEIGRYHSGLNLVFDALEIWRHLVRDTRVPHSLLRYFETDLAQVKLSVTTGNT